MLLQINGSIKTAFDKIKMWATVVAMSSGQILINEKLDKLTQERKEIFTNILPPE